MSGFKLAWIKFSRDRLAFSGFLIVFLLVIGGRFGRSVGALPGRHLQHSSGRAAAAARPWNTTWGRTAWAGIF